MAQSAPLPPIGLEALMSEQSPISAARDAIANLGDDQVRDAIDALVRGLVRGGLGDLVRRADQIIDEVVDTIIDQLAALGESSDDSQTTDGAGPYDTPEVFTPATLESVYSVDPVKPGPTRQDTVTRTCVICGRQGTRRYVQDAMGWRCSPTATACPGNRSPEPAPAPSDIPAKPIQPNVTPAPELAKKLAEPPKSTPTGPKITARCDSCPRTWNLTGRVLEQAASLHEAKHDGHVVDILGDES